MVEQMGISFMEIPLIYVHFSGKWKPVTTAVMLFALSQNPGKVN